MTQRNLTVADLMSRLPVTVQESATVAEAEREMQQSDIRHLPVVDENGKLVGLVSDRDLIGRVGSAEGRATALRKIMTRDVLSVRAETLAREASLILLEHKIGSLVVVGAGGELLGMLTETDFLRFAHESLGGDRLAVDDG